MESMCPNKPDGQNMQCCWEEAAGYPSHLERWTGRAYVSLQRQESLALWENGAQWEFLTHGAALPARRSLLTILTLNGHDI